MDILIMVVVGGVCIVVIDGEGCVGLWIVIVGEDVYVDIDDSVCFVVRFFG